MTKLKIGKILFLAFLICTVAGAAYAQGKVYWTLPDAAAHQTAGTLAAGGSALTYRLVAEIPAGDPAKVLKGYKFTVTYDSASLEVTEVKYVGDVFTGAINTTTAGTVVFDGFSKTGVTGAVAAATPVSLVDITIKGKAASVNPLLMNVVPNEFGTTAAVADTFLPVYDAADNLKLTVVPNEMFFGSGTTKQTTVSFEAGMSQTVTLLGQIPAGSTLKAFSVELWYDSAKVTVSSATLGTAFGTNGAVNSATPGVIKANGWTKAGVTASPAALLNITMMGTAVGTFNFTVTKIKAFGEAGNTQFIPGSAALSVTVTPPTTTTTVYYEEPTTTVAATTTTVAGETTTTVEGGTTTTVEGATTTTTVVGPVVTTTMPSVTTTTIPSTVLTLKSPADGTTDVPLTTELKVDSGGKPVIFKVMDSTGKVVYTADSSTGTTKVPDLMLSGSQDYTWTAALAETPTLWSTPRMFKTAVEVVDPKVTVADTGLTATITTDKGAVEIKTASDTTKIESVKTTGATETMPSGTTAIKATVTNPGDTAVIEIELPEAMPEGATWAVVNGTVYDYTLSPDRKKVTLSIKDGDKNFDLDGMENGVIVAGAAGVYVQESTTPTTVPAEPGQVYEDNDNCFISTMMGR